MHRDDDHLRYKLNNPLTIVVVAVVVCSKHDQSSITFFHLTLHLTPFFFFALPTMGTRVCGECVYMSVARRGDGIS